MYRGTTSASMAVYVAIYMGEWHREELHPCKSYRDYTAAVGEFCNQDQPRRSEDAYSVSIMETPTMTRRPLILNVEDRDGPRYVKSRILHRASFAVLEATTGQVALSLVRQHAPALILLGLALPDINGLEVCRLIKGDPET